MLEEEQIHTIYTAERGIDAYSEIERKRQYRGYRTAIGLTHSFINIALQIRIFGIRSPELFDYIRLVQVEIDDIDES